MFPCSVYWFITIYIYIFTYIYIYIYMYISHSMCPSMQYICICIYTFVFVTRVVYFWGDVRDVSHQHWPRDHPQERSHWVFVFKSPGCCWWNGVILTNILGNITIHERRIPFEKAGSKGTTQGFDNCSSQFISYFWSFAIPSTSKVTPFFILFSYPSHPLDPYGWIRIWLFLLHQELIRNKLFARFPKLSSAESSKLSVQFGQDKREGAGRPAFSASSSQQGSVEQGWYRDRYKVLPRHVQLMSLENQTAPLYLKYINRIVLKCCVLVYEVH